ncbi:hypothetical protein [Reyranella sp. CPCC 100927]|uniref:hypothetical protein n=1 Tax=Reyranella sp. CPCC 100927 TaxID=2599616 RepID=UPI0011B40AB5|nr:hypothetical protein [Reyranella sp. CPCC 100927]TWT14131.1 hypothetical protein FQU96_09575 [Reyranella sp. CPCC 100927]
MDRRFAWAVVISPPVSGALTNVFLEILTLFTTVRDCWAPAPLCDYNQTLHLRVAAHSAMMGLAFGMIVGTPLMASLGRLLIGRLQAIGYKRLRHYVITGIGCGLLVSLVFNFGIPDPSRTQSSLMAGSIVFTPLAFAVAWLILRPDRARTTQ